MTNLPKCRIAALSTAAQARVCAAYFATRKPLGARALSIDASLTRRAADAIAERGVAAVGNPLRRVRITELAFAAALEFVSGLVTTQGVLWSTCALPVDAHLVEETTSVGGSAALGFPNLAYTLRPAVDCYAFTGIKFAAHISTRIIVHRAFHTAVSVAGDRTVPARTSAYALTPLSSRTVPFLAALDALAIAALGCPSYPWDGC
jgi:imidazoleglycerol phosphate dehydratase HisB